MTTTLTIHVNGRYRATVTHNDYEPVVVEGNYEGSPNPSGARSFSLHHGTENNFHVSEKAVPDAKPVDGTAKGATFTVGTTQMIDEDDPDLPITGT